MKPIPEGFEASFSLRVTDEMTVDFEEMGRLHPVYATYWLAKHMELVSRKVILPFLEAEEEGIGFEVQVTHLASALPGMRVTVSARHLRSEGKRIYSSCEAVSELGDRIGTGTTTQVVLPRATLEAGFEGLRRRWQMQRDNR
ncbi:MAG: thioesterase family protein [Deinococcota bacterium]|jgi:predicted thioesterase|nr:thioesterase family protein [Deinococcota bacterium]